MKTRTPAKRIRTANAIRKVIATDPARGWSAKVIAHMINESNGHTGNNAGKGIEGKDLAAALKHMILCGIVTRKRAMCGSGCAWIYRLVQS